MCHCALTNDYRQLKKIQLYIKNSYQIQMICTQFYSFKYSFQMLIIYAQFYELWTDTQTYHCWLTNKDLHTSARCPHGVMVKTLNCGIIVSEFKLQLCYYVHFQTNTLGKGMNPLILPAMGYIASLLFFWKDCFGIK